MPLTEVGNEIGERKKSCWKEGRVRAGALCYPTDNQGKENSFEMKEEAKKVFPTKRKRRRKAASDVVLRITRIVRERGIAMKRNLCSSIRVRFFR